MRRDPGRPVGDLGSLDFGPDGRCPRRRRTARRSIRCVACRGEGRAGLQREHAADGPRPVPRSSFPRAVALARVARRAAGKRPSPAHRTGGERRGGPGCCHRGRCGGPLAARPPGRRQRGRPRGWAPPDRSGPARAGHPAHRGDVALSRAWRRLANRRGQRERAVHGRSDADRGGAGGGAFEARPGGPRRTGAVALERDLPGRVHRAGHRPGPASRGDGAALPARASAARAGRDAHLHQPAAATGPRRAGPGRGPA